MTSANCTRCWRARARTRIQPRGRAERNGANERRIFGVAHQLQPAERDAAALIVAGDLLQRPMQIDRLVVACLTHERDEALRLAERISADEMRALGKERDGTQKLGDLRIGIAMTEYRQSERRFRDEEVAGQALESHARGVAEELVDA